MTLPRGRIAKPIKISAVRDLVRADVAKLTEPRASPPRVRRFRESHHYVAHLTASGLSLAEIADLTGYSAQRIWTLQSDPAFQELVAVKRGKLEELSGVQLGDFLRGKLKLMAAADRHMADHIEELDESDELLPLKTALQLSADMSDRVGFGKHNTQTNVNVNFADALEKCIARSGKAISPAGPAAGRGPVLNLGAERVLIPFKRRI